MSLLVGANLYDLVEADDGLGGLGILIGEVAAADGRAAVPERVVPILDARVPPFAVVISEANTVADGAWVRGLCSYLIQANGVTIYGRPAVPTIERALVEAAWALGKLKAHPVRWWEPADYTDRPIWRWGRPARVVGFNGLAGQCAVGYEDEPLREEEVDILSDATDWFR